MFRNYIGLVTIQIDNSFFGGLSCTSVSSRVVAITVTFRPVRVIL